MSRTFAAETFARDPVCRVRKNVEAGPEAEEAAKVEHVVEVEPPVEGVALERQGVEAAPNLRVAPPPGTDPGEGSSPRSKDVDHAGQFRSGAAREGGAHEAGRAPQRQTGQASPPLSEQSDQELLEGLRAQSEPHFSELYRRYFQRIYNFVYARMRNHAETEEVVQETFLAVFRSFENYRGQSSLLSWIYGIAKNTTNNSLRRARSQSERIDLAHDEDLLPRTSLGEGTPDEQLDLHRFQDQLSDRLGRLADWQTEIFEMRHLENLSIPEISTRTERSSDAVRSSLYRVKRVFYEAARTAGNGSGGHRP